jgi:uncharacterized protein (DUF433 family)
MLVAVVTASGDEPMKQDISLVDQGRGLQLSTHRVTVQDLVPYFQRGCSYDEIVCWIPTLTHEEIAVVEQYYREHKEELDAEDEQIRARNAQRKNPPWAEQILEAGRAKMRALREQLQRDSSNGENK